MNKNIELIRQRRELLVMRAELQRIDLALQIEPWKKPLSTLDRALLLVRRMREHSTLIMRTLATFTFSGRTRLGRLLALGQSAWRAYRLLVKEKKA